MNSELSQAAEEILAASSQTKEFQRRLVRLLEIVTTSNYKDADVRQVIELAEFTEEE